MIDFAAARAWYPAFDAVHGFDHIERVTTMALRLGKAEGADLEIIRAAALLHDAQGSTPGGAGRGDHHEASARFARQILENEGWQTDRIEAVLHCVRAHRYRAGLEQPHTIEAKCVFDADKLDVLGAVGVARTIAYATLAGQPSYAEPSPTFIQTGVCEPGEPHSAYHEYLFKLRHVAERLFTITARGIAIEREKSMAAYFENLSQEMKGER